MSNTASDKILDIVKVARESAYRAERNYNDSAMLLKAKSQRSINLFGGSAVSQVADIVSESKMICDELYAAYQVLVEMVDSQCRPLLDETPDYIAVREVRDLIRWLNDESEIQNNFAASFNGTKLGDVASGRYMPSMSNKMIQQFWVTKCDMWPGKEEAEAEEREKREAEAEQTQKNEEKERKRTENEYRKELAEWTEKSEQIKRTRQEKLREAIEKLKNDKITAIESKRNEVLKQAETIKIASKEQLAEAEKKLSSLGMFALAEKKACKDIMKKMSDEIYKADTNCTAAEREYHRELGMIESWINEQTPELEKKIENKFPLPKKPLNEKEKEIDKYKKEIVSVMYHGVGYTAREIRDAAFDPIEVNGHRMNLALNELVRDGVLTRNGLEYILH